MMDPFAKPRPILNARMLQFWPTQDQNNRVNGAVYYNSAKGAFFAIENNAALWLLNPIGTIIESASANTPPGYLLCNGAAVSRTTYARLFSEIGTTYGAGDGSTTFNLPDRRGRTGIGAGQGTGLTNRTLGGSLGAEDHTLTVSEIPAHSHTYVRNGNTLGVSGGGSTQCWYSTSTVSSSSVGGGGGHNTMQPSLVMNYFIRF